MYLFIYLFIFLPDGGQCSFVGLTGEPSVVDTSIYLIE